MRRLFVDRPAPTWAYAVAFALDALDRALLVSIAARRLVLPYAWMDRLRRAPRAAASAQPAHSSASPPRRGHRQQVSSRPARGCAAKAAHPRARRRLLDTPPAAAPRRRSPGPLGPPQAEVSRGRGEESPRPPVIRPLLGSSRPSPRRDKATHRAAVTQLAARVRSPAPHALRWSHRRRCG
jgi:hypothetical protein